MNLGRFMIVFISFSTWMIIIHYAFANGSSFVKDYSAKMLLNRNQELKIEIDMV